MCTKVNTTAPWNYRGPLSSTVTFNLIAEIRNAEHRVIELHEDLSWIGMDR